MTYATRCRQNTSSSRRGGTTEKIGGDAPAPDPRAQRRKGFLKVREDDLPLAAHFLTGIRNYVSQMYLDANPPKPVRVDQAVRLYRQLLCEGVFLP